jgi:hypothetical protein
MISRMAALTLALFAFASPLCRADDKPGADRTKAELRDELKKRVQEDQEARRAMLKWRQENKENDAAKVKQQTDVPILKKLAETDEANTKWLKGVVEKHGWPGKSLAGADGAHDAWLLVQHADRDKQFQKKCLELMKPLASKGEVAKSDLAYLTDRVLVSESKKQLYGTQFHTVDGKLEPQPIEDEANVDKRRAEMGLPPMAEYKKMMENTYQKK